MHFREEVLRHLRLASDATGKVWELTQPHLLYLGQEQAEGYLKAKTNTAYVSGFHRSMQHLSERFSHFAVKDAGRFTIVDLGPGYPDKTLPIMRTCGTKRIPFAYVPVDINPDYLALAGKAASEYTTEIFPLRKTFEASCRDIQLRVSSMKDDEKLLVYLGPAFMNFEPQDIMRLLKKMIMNPDRDAACWFGTEVIAPGNTVENIIERYDNPEILKFAFGPLSHLGIEIQDCASGVRFNHEKSRIEMSYTLLSTPHSSLPIQEGDRIITAVSYKYTPRQFLDLVQEEFSDVSYLGAVESGGTEEFHDTGMVIAKPGYAPK